MTMWSRGSVRKAANRVSVTVPLIDAETNSIFGLIVMTSLTYDPEKEVAADRAMQKALVAALDAQRSSFGVTNAAPGGSMASTGIFIPGVQAVAG